MRTGMMILIVFSAETVPSFDSVLNLIGGSGVALTSAILPCIFIMFFKARYSKANNTLNINNKSLNSKIVDTDKEPPIPSLKRLIHFKKQTVIIKKIYKNYFLKNQNTVFAI